MMMQKQIVGTNFVISDSIQNIEWKITNENREIAGYNCRKAVGKIMDDVYIFAFYTDEITITGGPCSIHGLPGLILGLSIPRLYTSYVATKVDLTMAKASEIKPITAKKTYDLLGLKKEMEEKTKELQYQLGFVASVEAKLNNERFVSGAPAAVVEKEKAKLADGQERIKILKDDLARLEEMKNA